MKKFLIALIFLVMPLLVISVPVAVAQRAVSCGCYCGKTTPPPCSDEKCKQACGYQEPSSSGSTPSTPQPTYDYEAERRRQEEAERQRQQELENQRKRKEEEARKKQEEFERNKKEALKEMKGTSGSELGLKGTGQSGELGLKGIGETNKSTSDRAYTANCPKWDPNKARTVKIDEKSLCPGNLTCMTYFCGGGTGCSYVCCPKGLPYLNHCDCKCYSSSDFDCKSYSKCEPR